MDSVKKAMQANNFDSLLVTSMPSLYYFTGLPAWYTADNNLVFILEKLSPVAALVSADGKVRLICAQSVWEFANRTADFDEFYGTRSSMHMERVETVPVAADNFLDAVAKAITDAGAKRVAVEARYLSMEWHEGLVARLPGVTYPNGLAMILDLKLHKSEREIDMLRKATALNVRAMRASLDALRAGATERELHKIVKRVLLEGGGCWNQTTIGCGFNGAVPYNIPGDRVLQDGDFIRYDIGGTLDGYSSDLARCAVVGKGNPDIIRLHETLLAGQDAALAIIKPGVTFSEIFNVSMGHVWKNGYPDYRRGNVGHTIGIELEEEPFIAPDNHTVLEPGMVLAVELPWYSPKYNFGFNVEDNILITENGYEDLSVGLSRALYYR